MKNPTQQPLSKAAKAQGRHEALEEFEQMEEQWCKAFGDLVTLEIIKNDAHLDMDIAKRTMDAVSFYLRKHLSDLDDHMQACYRAVRRSWGHDD